MVLVSLNEVFERFIDGAPKVTSRRGASHVAGPFDLEKSTPQENQ